MPTIIDREELGRRMVAACRTLQAKGQYPSVARLMQILEVGEDVCGQVRRSLVEAGEIKLGMRPPRDHPDPMGPFDEQPDDPDADEIRRRIAEVDARRVLYDHRREVEYVRAVYRVSRPTRGF